MNPGPHTCKACALPLSYIPLPRAAHPAWRPGPCPPGCPSGHPAPGPTPGGGRRSPLLPREAPAGPGHVWLHRPGPPRGAGVRFVNSAGGERGDGKGVGGGVGRAARSLGMSPRDPWGCSALGQAAVARSSAAPVYLFISPSSEIGKVQKGKKK